MGLLDDAKSGVSKWFEGQVAKNKAFKAAGGMVKSNPAMTRSMGLLPATGLLEQEGDAAARADAAYGALRKEYGPLGLRPGDFVPFASGGLAIDDARLAAAKGNYGQAAGSLAGVIPVAGAVGKVVRKITGGKSSGVIDSVKREIFAGPNAKTANKAAMKRAEARLAAGDDPATVWAQEGWGRGPDGKMRWEIDDSQAFPDLFGASDDYGKPLREGTLFPLNQSYEHQALYKSYPEIGDNVNIGFMPQERMGQAYGAYSGKHKRITLPDGEKRHFFEKSNLAHEVQHAVQDAEDFSRGGSPEGMRDEALAMLRRDVASGDIGSTEQAMNMLPMAQRNAYNRLAGEAESRLTEARIDMSPAERAAQYPWAEDYFKQATGVSKGDLIHRGGLLSDGPALSVGKADIDVSYRGSHSAPSAEFGAPLNDMTRGMYPDDFYSQNGLRYYGSGSDGEKEAFAIAQKVRGKPDAMVTAYRAVPKGAQSELNAGDWIATSKAYARQHGDSVLNGDYDIISQKVPAKHIYTNADSISEYGYDPTGLGLTGQSGLLNPEITKATNRGLYRTMLDDEEDKPSFPYGLIGK